MSDEQLSEQIRSMGLARLRRDNAERAVQNAFRDHTATARLVLEMHVARAALEETMDGVLEAQGEIIAARAGHTVK